MKSRLSVLTGVICAFLAFGASSALAVPLDSLSPLPSSKFEGGDAGALSTTVAQWPVGANYDWKSFGTLPLATLADPQPPDDPATAAVEGDSYFAGGNKETEPDNWVYLRQPGGVTPAKSNILAGWAIPEQTSTKTFLNLAFYREAPSGDTFLTFELNQAPAGMTWENAAGQPIPCRQTGDILISYEVTPGGQTPVEVKIYRWTSTPGEIHPTVGGDGITYECGGYGSFTEKDLSTSEVEAAMNFASSIENYLDPDGDPLTNNTPGTIDQGKFGEASIDLIAALGGVGEDACFSFGSWQLHSRSSVSIDSQLQDTLGPEPILVRNCTLQVKKVVVPSTDSGKFNLTIDGVTKAADVGDGGHTLAVVVGEGNHTVAETAGTGTSLSDYSSSYSCVNNQTGTPITGSGTAVTGGITVAKGDNWVCTFTNIRDAKVTLEKKTLPAGYDQDFVFTASGNGLSGQTLNASTTPTHVFTVKAADQAGDHSFTETVPSDWSLTGVSCGVAGQVVDGSKISFGAIEPGAEITCTFTNTKHGHVIIDKVTEPSGDAQEFTFTTDFAAPDDSFTLTDEATPRDVAVEPGTYHVAETVPSGWDLTGLTCTGQAAAAAEGVLDPEATIEVGAGETVECTYTNTKHATVTVTKVTDPVAQNADFGFSSTGAGLGSPTLNASDPKTDHATYELSSSQLGSHSFTEAAKNGYRLTDIVCTGVDAQVAGRTATFDVVAGAEINCTFTNKQISTALLIVKVGAPKTVHDGESVTFTYSVSNPATSNGSLTITSISDDRCSPITGPTAKTGGNQDEMLDPGETWTYTCTTPVKHEWEDANHVVTNTVTVKAEDEFKNPLEAKDDETTKVIHPAIAIDKTGPSDAIAGANVIYTLTVTNPGDTALHAVVVNDPVCDVEAPGQPDSKNGDTTPDTLDPGDVWVYSCTASTHSGQTEVDNVATVQGNDQLEKTVTATDTAVTTLAEQLVLPERIIPGNARLLGPTGCVYRPFYARVRGIQIAKVVFYLDGKKIKTVAKPNLGKLYAVRINPATLKVRVHRVIAVVTFKADSQTKAKTFRLSFQRCAKKLLAPRFTG